MTNRVAIVEHKAFEEDVIRAFQLIDYEIPKARLVLIKPNLCGEAEPTAIELVHALVKLFGQRSGRVVVGDTNSTTKRADERIRLFGLDKKVRESGGEALGLMKTPIIKVRIPQPLKNDELPLPKLALDADVLVNAPLLRQHRTTKVTCCMKNLYGLIATMKFRYHIRRVVHETIIDVNSVLRPSVNVVDCTLGGEGVVMAGREPYFVDVLAARLLGHDPEDLKLLRLASKRFGMPLDFRQVEVLGMPFEEAHRLVRPIREK